MTAEIKLSQLSFGEEAIIQFIEAGEICNKLMTMGILPGEKIKVSGVAPLGDPIKINCSDISLSMRKEEASFVWVNKEIL